MLKKYIYVGHKPTKIRLMMRGQKVVAEPGQEYESELAESRLRAFNFYPVNSDVKEVLEKKLAQVESQVEYHTNIYDRQCEDADARAKAQKAAAKAKLDSNMAKLEAQLATAKKALDALKGGAKKAKKVEPKKAEPKKEESKEEKKPKAKKKD